MAKKTNRVLLGLQCGVCKRQNYVTEKNKVNTADKVVMKKFCSGCKKYTEHKERQRLK